MVALDAMGHRHLVTVAALESYRRPGVTLPPDRLALVEPRTESPMETHVRMLLHDAGVPPPVARFVVRDRAGRASPCRRTARVDFACPPQRVAVEHGGDHHRSRATFRRDVAR